MIYFCFKKIQFYICTTWGR